MNVKKINLDVGTFFVSRAARLCHAIVLLKMILTLILAWCNTFFASSLIIIIE